MSKENNRYLTDTKWDSFKACSIAEGFCGGEDASEEEKHDAWQYIVDSGLWKGLQGWYGRTANSLIEQGLILPA
jgi:hypothetical protein